MLPVVRMKSVHHIQITRTTVEMIKLETKRRLVYRKSNTSCVVFFLIGYSLDAHNPHSHHTHTHTGYNLNAHTPHSHHSHTHMRVRTHAKKRLGGAPVRGKHAQYHRTRKCACILKFLEKKSEKSTITRVYTLYSSTTGPHAHSHHLCC